MFYMDTKKEEYLKKKKEKRREYNQTYYDKHRLELLQKYRENFISQKVTL